MTRPNRFFRITVGLLALLVLAGAAIALLVGFNIDRINRDGGYAILMALFVFVALMAIVGVGTIITTALSLRKGEAHRGFSVVVLIVSCLVVFRFGTGLVGTAWSQWRMSREDARTRQEPPRLVVRDGGTEVPDSLVEHFRRQGFSIRPAQDWRSSREWTLDVADVGPIRCEVVLSFRGFARGLPVEVIKQRLMEFNAASVLNEHANLAMFYPFARGKTGDKADCEAWTVKSKDIVDPLLDAFRSYRP